MNELILIINAGSSSIKFSLFEQTAADPVLQFNGQVDGIFTQPQFSAKDAAGQKIANEPLPADAPKSHDTALRYVLDWLKGHTEGRKLAVIGHRVVHGGTGFSQPVRVTPDVIAQLEQTVPLAPLHAPHNIGPMKILAGLLPDVPQVACFDTAFHRTQPELNQLYALPLELAEREGLRRWGFHGLSYEYIASVLPQIDAKAAQGRTVVCHLGNGASMAALLGSVCQLTTMGFTALEGLPMGTRTGTLDPAIVLFLMTHLKMNTAEIETLLYKESGLLGLSGISSDMRELHASNDPRAKLAVDYFANRIVQQVGSLSAALQGLDALVFTAGIGENDEHVRASVCKALGWLGVELDKGVNNTRSSKARRISTEASRVAVYVIPTNEELMIARHATRVVGA
ncbi:acetate/propionate family kinase [Amantichitinum ursilacus]|uniref:Acetate kinase n=1 Tax=Amantichitinum ursilacus TaxID=857265 RepID=A0A0N1JSG8_9NEIS|nr:acetate kinase [Amantichitinum ursilacus]KPC52137.1 Acetate kinase [Amantichitinum ursilacus]